MLHKRVMEGRDSQFSNAKDEENNDKESVSGSIPNADLKAEVEDNCQSEVSCWTDRFSMAILLVLYTLQGIPMGLSGSIPLLMKERGVSFEGLALFSLVSVPFSLKLLWAPLVDSIYIRCMGRRKTWLVPVQLLCGLVMIVGSYYINHWMRYDSDALVEPDVDTLTFFFLFLYFLMATQDIAVDGWALTMLSKSNVGYASTCNSIGQSFGFFLANQGFIALSDKDWCKRFLGLENGSTLVDIAGFMQFWGWIFIATTLLVWFFKVEHPLSPAEEPEGIIDTYRHVFAIFRLPSIKWLCLILCTCKIAFAPADSVSGFKLQEYGMPKADIATISPLLLVIGLVLPAVASSAVSSRPMEMFLFGIPLKLLTSALTWGVFQHSISAYAGGTVPGISFFGPLIAVMILHEIAGNLIFVSMMAFFAKVSDPAIGGTYMTLLNTLANLGSKWPNSAALWLLPRLTQSSCISPSTSEAVMSSAPQGEYLSSSCLRHKSDCTALGGVCRTDFDGYTIETFVCIAIGICWVFAFRGVALNLQSIPMKEWLVTSADRQVSLVRVPGKSRHE